MELTRTEFRELGVSAETLRVLQDQGFRHATRVQAETIPRLCRGMDVVVSAATGSGKTLAFVIPLVDALRRMSPRLKPHQVGGLIIAPTRELASQIFHVTELFLECVEDVDAILLVGGGEVSLDVEKMTSSQAKLLVGTPGRLQDIMQRCSDHLDFDSLKMLILDEADRLLEMGYDRHVAEIIKLLPQQRTTGLFSATQTDAVKELAKAGLRPFPTIIKVETETKTPVTLNVQYLICDADEKSSQLVHFLLENVSKKVIVYFITCASVDYWGTVLSKIPTMKHVPTIVLHGRLKQRAREKALQKFTEMPAGVLFCTDVAARGLDIPGVDWIVQYDPPQDPNMFVHRVGRTARMGRPGNSVAFLLPKEETYAEFLRVRNIPVEERTKFEATDIIPMLRAAALSDRDIMEKGLKAFVSYFRAYKEHHCNYIFRWKSLQLGKTAMGFGLLQLPSMPELKQGIFNSQHFVPVEGIDLSSIKYKNKAREKRRKKMKNASATESRKPVSIKAKPEKRKAKERTEKRLSSKKRTWRDIEEINEDYRQLVKERRRRT